MKKSLFIALSTLALCGISPISLEAKPEPAAAFGDCMVLQRETPVPVWGRSAPGEKITVVFGGQKKTSAADAAGKWSVKLDAMPANAEGREMTVTGKDGEVKFSDILVGEVWLCSGQSNMEKPLGAQPGQRPTFNVDNEIAAANFPQIRLLKVKRTGAGKPADDVQLAAPWTVCSPQTIDKIKFSAAGYFFGKKLHTELNVPVGLIDSTWGGTRIEPWTAPEGFASVPALTGAKGSALYNAMIHPIVPFAMRGVIWYQGESNMPDAREKISYAEKMTALVQGWRQVWQRDLAFYYVQIAPYLYHLRTPLRYASPEDAALLREAQADAMRLPHSGMVVTTDLADDVFDIHPRNKKDVGERLARWALAKDYGKKDVVCSGPVFSKMKIDGNRAVLSFDNVAGGLESKAGKPLTWFTVAGEDGVFWSAKAEIKGETIVISSPKVPAPKAVRFAWDEAAQPNFYNKAGLPAVPFRTDRK